MNNHEIINNSDVNILVVEDSRTQAAQLKYILEQHNYNIELAESGEMALELIKQNLPTVIISDIIMPGINGYELCQKIKKDNALMKIPVILLTSLSEPIDVIRGLECGADNFIIKPYEEKNLLNRLQYMLINMNLRSQDQSQMIIEINFLGEKYQITSDRLQILNLLLTTYETAVERNKDLAKAQYELKVLNESLENKVRERTEELLNEINRRKSVEEELRKTNDELEIRVALRTEELNKVNEKLKIELIEKEKNERILRLSEERFSKAFRLSPNLMLIYDLSSGKIIETNQCFLKYTDYSHDETDSYLITKISLFDEKTYTDIQQTIEKKNRIQNVEINYKTKSGKTRIGLLSAEIIEIGGEKCVLSIINDITEKRKLEEELYRRHNIEAIGVLAGGIAHDFNNILTSIVGNISLATYTLNPDEKTYQFLAKSLKSADQAKDLTKKLVTFAKGGNPINEIGSITKLIDEVIPSVLGDSSIPYKIELAEDIPDLEFDKDQISQVISQIVINAKDAIKNSGEIIVLAENVSLSEEMALLVPPGKYVKISIQDTGTGIPKNIIDKVFDPYFSTKSVSQGLGLTVAYSIINHHNGFIDLKSTEGVGTSVDIFLPTFSLKDESIITTEKKARKITGKILVMDDEEPILDFLTDVMVQFDFTTECYGNSRETIEAYKKALNSDQPFDLVILDLTIPGEAGGKETIKQLKKIDVKVKAIVSSGYSDSPIVSKYEDYGFIGRLIKPYEIKDVEQLLSKVFE